MDKARMKFTNWIFFSAWLIIIALLMSCQTKAETTIMTSPTIRATKQVKATNVNTRVATPVPKLSVTATSIAVFTETPMPINTVTPTPIPTLVPKKAVSRVMDLLHDTHNPNCLLPCWWGAIPGQTDLYDVISYLKPFAYKIGDFSEQTMFTTLLVPENIDYTGKLHVTYGINTSKIVTGIWVSAVNIEGYDPQTMMSLYGVPDEVWINTVPYVLQGDVLPFDLFIVYQEQGISFRYYVDASIAEKTVTACFRQGVVEIDMPELFPTGPQIFLWEPGQSKSIDEIHEVPGDKPFPLEEKTELTPQTFYEKFTDPNKSPCINTPSDLWE